MMPIPGMKKAHFVGIGGAGMSSLAEVMYKNGFEVTGSDAAKNEVTNNLEQMGIQLLDAENSEGVSESDVVIYSSAIPKNNNQLQTAHKHGIPVIKRAVMLGELMKKKHTVAVSGTHGKTTTTLMLGSIWSRTDWNPTIMGGGIEMGAKSGTIVGDGPYLIAEADEYDRSFLSMYPTAIALTNIDSDHLDTYGSLGNIKQAFLQFMNGLPFFGFVVVNADDPGVLDVMPEITSKTITYGVENAGDYQAFPLESDGFGEKFSVSFKEEMLTEVQLKLNGSHNISNALAAFAVSHQMGVDLATIVEGLNKFKGVHRRMEMLGSAKGVQFLDDYAHHPSEIEAVLNTLKKKVKGRVIAVFQPHLYSRTKDFQMEFAYSLNKADKVFVFPIYAAREKPIPGVQSNIISDKINELEKGKSQLVNEEEDWKKIIGGELKELDLVVSLGAGDVNLKIKELFQYTGGEIES